MRRLRWAPYFWLVVSLFVVCNTPKTASDRTRLFCVSALSPSWEMCQFLKQKALLAFGSSRSFSSLTEAAQKELEELKRENRVLRMQLDNIKDWLLHEDRIEEQIQRLLQIAQDAEVKEDERLFYKRRQAQMASLLNLHMKALPAKVIYREPASWSSFIWVNLGEKHNRSLKESIIAKNSPVVIGTTLVGVVEEVHFSRSKIRLLTDPKLVPAVRAVRGFEQNFLLIKQVENLVQVLQTRQELFLSEKEAIDLLSGLKAICSRTGYFSEDRYLAKGEIYGSGKPLWRARGQMLHGVGFNYDFADEEGPSRDLRTGESLLEKGKKGVPLLQVGDLLITSGLDGVFLPGLEVGVVTEVNSLQEGSSSYQIKAKALIHNFDELDTVFILPSLEGKI